MPDLSDLRALIKDHEEKDAGLTVDVQLCLKTDLLDDLADLEGDRAMVVQAADGSMSAPDTTEMDARIDAMKAEIDAATIVLHFKALTDPKYRAVLREFPTVGQDDAKTEDEAAFLARLTEQCYRGVNYGGQEFTAADLPWRELQDRLSFGEVDPIHGEVFALNRGNKSRRPLSSTRSKRNRST